MSWISTHTGRKFDLLDPRVEDVELADIAHALGNLCRFGGHCNNFYSVAEHSVHVAGLLPPELKLQGLMHDATEAYLVDVPRPIKVLLGGYAEMEDRVWAVIAERFNLPLELDPKIKYFDNAILLAEARAFMYNTPQNWFADAHLYERPKVDFQGWTPREAREWFTRRFRELT